METEVAFEVSEEQIKQADSIKDEGNKHYSCRDNMAVNSNFHSWGVLVGDRFIHQSD
jgi:hypothetical protein